MAAMETAKVGVRSNRAFGSLLGITGALLVGMDANTIATPTATTTTTTTSSSPTTWATAR